MDERVRVEKGVRLARPRIQRLAPEMEREATALLAALLADTAKRQRSDEGAPIGIPFRVPIGTPKNAQPEPGEPSATRPNRQALAESDNRGEK
jgi:hypothetical protein